MDAEATTRHPAQLHDDAPGGDPKRRLRPDDEPITRDGELTVPRNGLATWYLMAYAEEVRSGAVVARTMHGREIVLYRGRESGRVFALSAHCSHMGTHLKHGDVTGDELRCALHHWRFDGAGACTAASGCDSPPTWARQRSFPVQERHGAIFVFNGRRPTFDVPTWEGVEGDRVMVGHTKSIHLQAHWAPLALNAWDGMHLKHVHHRAVRTPPEVSFPDESSCRISWHADVTGTHLADRFTKLAAGRRGVRAHITNHGGMLLLIDSRVGRLAPSRLMLGLDPQMDGSVVVRAMFPVERSWIPLWAQLRMRIQRRLFRSFLAPDAAILADIRYRPRTPLPDGEPLGPALEFLASRPNA